MISIILMVLVALNIAIGVSVAYFVWKILNKIATFTQNDVAAAVREEMRVGREESERSAKILRDEVGQSQLRAESLFKESHNLLIGSLRNQREEVIKTMNMLADNSRKDATSLRDEIAKIQKANNDSLVDTIGKMGVAQKADLDEVVKSVNQIVETNKIEIAKLRDDLKLSQKESNEGFLKTLNSLGDTQKSQLEGISKAMKQITDTNKIEITNLREELKKSQKELNTESVNTLKLLGDSQKIKLDDVTKAINQVIDKNRTEITTLKEDVKKMQSDVNKNLVSLIENMGKSQKEKLDDITNANNKLREKLEAQFKEIQNSNEKKLDEMRKTVDEKLHNTLEERLGKSFKLVSDRLEAVQQGLGEMKNLANGVGNLQRLLTNVKDRGTWGEVQLEAILEHILIPEQYEKNAQTKENSRERVEFAIRLPGKNGNGEKPILLPIDAKFPKEDYERLVDASTKGDIEATKDSLDALIHEIEKCAKDIQEKHVNPPMTTDFAIMFLPTEGLYAEVLRQPGLHDNLQQKYRVIIAGPTTLAAILNSLRMGFHTLAIEKRSSEVWRILGAVKTEFGKFGDIINKVKDQLATASHTLDTTHVRTRAMSRKLSAVSALPQTEAAKLLQLGESSQDSENETLEQN